MNSSDEQRNKADRLLDTIVSLIGPVYIEENITAPLDAIRKVFSKRKNIEYSHENFHRTITEFIQTVSRQTQLYGGTLSEEAAHSEAVFLINHFYRGSKTQGIDGALADAIDPDQQQMSQVIRNLTTAMKDYAKGKHFESVKCRYIDAVGWQMRRVMTQRLLQRKRPRLVKPMDTWSLEQLSGRLWELIQKTSQF